MEILREKINIINIKKTTSVFVMVNDEFKDEFGLLTVSYVQ